MSGKPIVPLIEYEDASEAVRAVYDDIMATRKVDWINNFWKVLAHDPAHLKRTWETLRDVMAPGALDPLTKELIYIAVSATNGCEYCTYSHTASARGQGHDRGATDGTARGGRHGQRDQSAGKRPATAGRCGIRAEGLREGGGPGRRNLRRADVLSRVADAVLAGGLSGRTPSVAGAAERQNAKTAPLMGTRLCHLNAWPFATLDQRRLRLRYARPDPERRGGCDDRPCKPFYPDIVTAWLSRA